jgi:hypothetical protein
MRTFSKLKAFCSFPDTIPEKPSKRRDDAAAIGNLLHKAVEVWVATGDTAHFAGLPEPVRGWAEIMRQRWTPPENCETEIPLGLVDLPTPKFTAVRETAPGSHEYVPLDAGTKLLTAGRADLVWEDDEECVRVCDIKTGQFYLGDPARLRQVLAQGFAAASLYGAGAFRPGVYYARTGHFDWGQPVLIGEPSGDEAWRYVLDAAMRDTEPHPGAHCLGCWDKKACPANPVVEAA